MAVESSSDGTAWGNANMVNLVRDMLLVERDDTLHLLSGIPANWIAIGQEIRVDNATTTLGGRVDFRLQYPAAHKMLLEFTPPAGGLNLHARFPIPSGEKITSTRVDGRPIDTFSGDVVTLKEAHAPVQIEVEFQ